MAETSEIEIACSMSPVLDWSEWAEGQLPEISPHWSDNCQHDFRLRVKQCARGVKQARRQCSLCGQSEGQAEKLAGVIEPWDDELERRVRLERESHVEEHRRERDRIWQTLGVLRKAAYQSYLSSGVWREKRRIVIARCSGECESCGQRRAADVHHTRYPRVLGLEPLWWLRGVCRECHRHFHPDWASPNFFAQVLGD